MPEVYFGTKKSVLNILLTSFQLQVDNSMMYKKMSIWSENKYRSLFYLRAYIIFKENGIVFFHDIDLIVVSDNTYSKPVWEV